MPPTLRPAVRRIGPFRTLEFPAPAGTEKDALTIVLFHGYGANGADLAPLAAEVPLSKPARWEFPDGPLALPFGGLAWFEIDVAAIEEAQRTGTPVDWSDSDPEALADAREQALAFIKELGVPWDRLVLGGFSQGSMLATELALRAPQSPRGLVILSGNLICAKSWAELGKARKGLRFFQSHGLADPILGHRGALRLNALLNTSGLAGELETFEGGHAIPLETIESLGPYLDSL